MPLLSIRFAASPCQWGIERICAFLCVILCFGIWPAHSQLAVQSVVLNDIYQANAENGTGITVVDLDGNGWDDILVPRLNLPPVWLKNMGQASFETYDLSLPAGDYKAMVSADYDRDGDLDIFVTSFSGNSKLFNCTLPGESYLDVTLASGLDVSDEYSHMGACWGDINHDGWLDLHISGHFSLGSLFYINNGNGTFTEVAESYGVSNPDIAAFQGVFIDIDIDGDEDLYVIHDREPFDAVYINENGALTNISDSNGFNVYLNAMSNSFADFDNDGDWDVYVTGTSIEGNFLFTQTIPLFFQDTAQDLLIKVHRMCWGANWVDLNNDGWEDLYVCTDDPLGSEIDPIFMNEAGLYFSENLNYAFPTPALSSYAVAKGDFNRDGYYDLVVGNYNLPVHILMNSGGPFPAFRLELEGIQSNTNGIGTLIEYWAGGMRMMRYVMAGNNFLSQDSYTHLLSTSDAPVIDSLFLHWDSGITDRYFNLPAGHSLHAREGQTVYSAIQYTDWCEGDSLQLAVADSESLSWNWSTGVIGSMTTSTIPGQFSAYTLDQNNFLLFTDTVFLSPVPLPEWSVSSISPSCHYSEDGEISILTSFTNHIEWDSGDTTSLLANLASGAYEFVITNEQGCESQGEVILESPQPLTLEVLWQDGYLMASASGGTPPFSYEWSNGATTFDLITPEPGFYSVIITDSMGCQAFAENTVPTSVQDAAARSQWLMNMNQLVWTGAGRPPKATITDSLGRTILQSDQLSECTLPETRGLYIISYIHGNNLMSLKISIQ